MSESFLRCLLLGYHGWCGSFARYLSVYLLPWLSLCKAYWELRFSRAAMVIFMCYCDRQASGIKISAASFLSKQKLLLTLTIILPHKNTSDV